MNKLYSAVVLLAAVLTTPAFAAGDAAAGEKKAAACVACHGQDGNSAGGDFPSIAGQGEKYIIKQLKDYKIGARKNAIMQGMVGGLSEEDMADLASFFASKISNGGTAKADLVAAGERFYRG